MGSGRVVKGKCEMKCEEFEAIGLGLDRESAAPDLHPIELAAAIEHANTCARCAALQESWQDAQVELQALGEASRDEGASCRGSRVLDFGVRCVACRRHGLVELAHRAGEYSTAKRECSR